MLVWTIVETQAKCEEVVKRVGIFKHYEAKNKIRDNKVYLHNSLSLRLWGLVRWK